MIDSHRVARLLRQTIHPPGIHVAKTEHASHSCVLATLQVCALVDGWFSVEDDGVGSCRLLCSATRRESPCSRGHGATWSGDAIEVLVYCVHSDVASASMCQAACEPPQGADTFL
jgi:hypothetical protein